MGIEEFADKLFRENRLVMDNLQEGIVVTRPDGKIVGWNKAFEDIIGSPGKDYSNTHVFRNYPFDAPEQKSSLLEQTINDRRTRTSTRVHYNKHYNGEGYLNIKIAPLVEEEKIEGTLVSFVDVTKEVLEAIRDGLTGAYTQSYYLRGLKETAIAQARRTIIKRDGTEKEGYLGIIGVDIKGLKRINDFISHDAGDDVIKGTAIALMESVRESDYVVRHGGDEFYVLCPGADEKGIEVIKEKINRKLLEHNSKLDKDVQIKLYMTSTAGGFDEKEQYEKLFKYIGETLKTQKRTP